MAAPMKQESATASQEYDVNAMEPPAGKYQMDLESAKPKHARGGKNSLSDKSKSIRVLEFGKIAKVGRSKSAFAYLFIGVGLLICLVWSATLFWFLVRGLLRLIF